MVELKLRVLEILHDDARYTAETLATMLDVSVPEVEAVIQELEDEKIIVKYATIVNWSKVDENLVTALI